MNIKHFNNKIRKKWFRSVAKIYKLIGKKITIVLLVGILLGSTFINTMVHALVETNQAVDHQPQELKLLEEVSDAINEAGNAEDEKDVSTVEVEWTEPSSVLDEKTTEKEKGILSEESKDNHESTEPLPSSEFTEEQTVENEESMEKVEEDLDTSDESTPTPEVTQDENHEIIASGNHGTDWQIYKEGEETILQIFPGQLNDFGNRELIPWLEYLSGITKVIVGTDSDDVSGKVIAPTNAMYLFSRLTNTTEIIGLENLDTSNVVLMQSMFNDSTSLTALDLSSWNTSNVTNMSWMFRDASNLTELNVHGWNTSKVTNMQSMFHGASHLVSLDLSGFDTSSVTNMRYMFYETSRLTALNLDGWNTSNVTTMQSMFRKMESLSSLDLNDWDVRNVQTMQDMFHESTGFTSLSLCNWELASVKNLSYMFKDTILKALDLSGWDTSSVSDNTAMFTGASSLNKLTLGEHTRFDMRVFLPPISTQGTYTGRWVLQESLNSQNGLITFGSSLSFMTNYDGTHPGTYRWEPKEYPSILVKYLDTEGNELAANETIIGFMGDQYVTEPKDLIGMTPIIPENASGTFAEEQTEIVYIYEKLWGTVPWDYDEEAKVMILYGGEGGAVEDAPWKYYVDVKEIKVVDSVTFPKFSKNMFANLEELEHIQRVDLFDTSLVTDMSGMFSHLPKLESLDINNWDTSNVTDMYGLFLDATKIQELDLSKWDVSKVTSLSGTFSEMTSLRKLNLSGWNTKANEEMVGGIMFGGTNILERLILGSDFVFPEGAGLSAIQAINDYTGRWVLEESLGSGIEAVAFESSADFMNRYDGSFPGNYVWESIVQPVDPLDPEKKVNPENRPNLPINQGYLSIDFASQLNFGTQMISTQKKIYYAQPQRLLDADGMVIEEEERPNYVQISDRRSENDRIGWQLSVRQNGQFKGEKENQELRGAELSLMNPQVITAQGGEAPILRNSGIVPLSPGVTQPLLTARGEEGRGTWVYRFGDHENAGESIALEVPAGANPEAIRYSTTLSWELSAVPDND